MLFHIRREHIGNSPFPYLFKLLNGQIVKDVVLVFIQNIKSRSAMMVLQNALIIVPKGQIWEGMRLKVIILSRVGDIVDQSRKQKGQIVQIVLIFHETGLWHEIVGAVEDVESVVPIVIWVVVQ